MADFDIIGDIHGHADALDRLLAMLGYALRDGVYRHPVRSVVFVGDFIDRGPQQVAVLHIARAMVEAGSAQAVMGNHEFNAIAWAAKGGESGFLRPHTAKNRAQHRAFLEQVGEGSKAHAEAVAWFRTLPLWLELGGLRVVHACWHPPSQEAIAGCVDSQTRLTARGLREVHDRSSGAFGAAEVLLKGPEARLQKAGRSATRTATYGTRRACAGGTQPRLPFAPLRWAWRVASRTCLTSLCQRISSIVTKRLSCSATIG